jgi:hypothetical protein
MQSPASGGKRLLPQPGGFEGLGGGAMEDPPNHAPIFQLPDRAGVKLDRHAARFSGCGLLRESNPNRFFGWFPAD